MARGGNDTAARSDSPEVQARAGRRMCMPRLRQGAYMRGIRSWSVPMQRAPLVRPCRADSPALARLVAAAHAANARGPPPAPACRSRRRPQATPLPAAAAAAAAAGAPRAAAATAAAVTRRAPVAADKTRVRPLAAGRGRAAARRMRSTASGLRDQVGAPRCAGARAARRRASQGAGPHSSATQQRCAQRRERRARPRAKGPQPTMPHACTRPRR